MGLSLGLDYAFSQRSYLGLSGGASLEYPLPFPAPFDRVGDYERLSVRYVSLRYHRYLGKFDAGAGFQASALSYFARRRGEDSAFTNYSNTTSVAGLSLSLRYSLLKNLRLGVLYQASLLDLTAVKVFPQHLVSVELSGRIEVFRRAKK